MQTILFLDDHFIAKTYKLARCLNYPTKAAANPVLRVTEPWESMLCTYGSVIFDEHVYKCFYTMWWLNNQPPYACDAEALAYAFSPDGVNWTKPELHIVKEVNQGKNNLIRYGRFADQPCVLRLAEPAAGKHYVMAYYGDFPPLGQGVRLCYSPDGIHWDWPGPLVWQTALDNAAGRLDFYAADDTISFYFDERLQRFVLLRKVMQETDLVYDPARHAHWQPDRDKLQRVIARCDSKDLTHWENHQIILAPDRDDPPAIDFHRLSVTPYAEQYVGLLEVHDDKPAAQTTELHLVSSRNGINWERPCRRQQPYIGRGAQADWDAGVVFTTPTFLCNEQEVRIYYGGMQGRLTAESLGMCRQYGVGLATIARDRFCSLRASASETRLLLTGPLKVNGQIKINANISDDGFLQVALCRATGEPLRGYDWADCDLGQGDLVNASVTWRNGDVPAPDNYHLYLRGRGMDLYALYIA